MNLPETSEKKCLDHKRKLMFILTPDLRRELKTPLGLLIRGSFKQTTEKLVKLLNEAQPKKLIAVGDRVSRNIIEKGIPLDVIIIDNKTMRKPVDSVKFEREKTLRISNPAGTITDEAWRGIKEAVDYEGRVKILVEGEEDLLTLVAVLFSPENSIVVYGQPREGIVVIKVTDDAKRKMQQILDRMKKLENAY